MLRRRCSFSRHVWSLMVPLLLAFGGLLILAPPTSAATIVVTDTGTAQNQDGVCTLVEALNNANNNLPTHAGCAPGQAGVVDTIVFNISAAQCPGGVCTILPDGEYTITDAVTIDGYTQPGASPNTLAVGSDAVLRIQVRPLTPAVPGAFHINANNVTIRGLSISGYASQGVRVRGHDARIVGCFIGVLADGITPNGNGLYGISSDFRDRLTVGGTSPADRNVISGQSNGTGISLDSADDVTILGNYIGVAANGTTPLPNRNGVSLIGTSRIRIGGTDPGARNVISGNTDIGVLLTSPAASVISTNGLIQGNYIGPDANGTVGTTPNGTGVSLSYATSNVIGGTVPGAGNVIAGNTTANVRIDFGGQTRPTGNAILGNAIYGSPGLGIDLAPNGVTPNDLGDGDGGSNNLQNFPVLTSARTGADPAATGTLNSRPNRDYRIEFFANTACDASGHGEGERYLGFVIVTTDGGGNAVFTAPVPAVPAGQFITATATDQVTNDTSELSACVTVRQAGITASAVSGPTTEADEGTAFDATFTVRLDSTPLADVSLTFAVSDPTEGAIAGPAILTFTPANATTPQSVRLIGIDDAIDDGDVAYAVEFAASTSTDAAYAGIRPPNVEVTNIDNDGTASPTPPTSPCTTRPRVNVAVTRAGNGQLRAVVVAGTAPGLTNELKALTWTSMSSASVTVEGIGPVQPGQRTALPVGTQTASFLVTRDAGASSATVLFTVTDVCGDWPTFVGGGPNAF